jgi:cytosine/adenosine deaminase-related metal-dependent hydrolase
MILVLFSARFALSCLPLGQKSRKLYVPLERRILTDSIRSQQRVFRVGWLFDGAQRFITDAELFVDNGKVYGICSHSSHAVDAAKLRMDFADADVVHLPRALLLPGLMNSHQHFYSAFARGMKLDETPQDFPAILEKLWWRLDRALDQEAVALSALVTALDGLHHGCTAVMDHHSSPSFIRGSLRTIADSIAPLHLTAVLCYEVTDRNGRHAFEDAVAENLDFAEQTAHCDCLRGLFGLHASFTLATDSLQRIKALKWDDLPIHVHVAEDQCDVADAQAKGFTGPLSRLFESGLLTEQSIIVHGVHLDPTEHEILRDVGVCIAHCAESNANNRVGHAALNSFPKSRLLLGTDGMSSNMLATLRATLLLASSHGNAPMFDVLAALPWRNPARYLSRLFSRSIGQIREGGPADFAVFPYDPPTPITHENLLSHLISGLSQKAEALWVYANGVPVIENGRAVTVDEERIYHDARETAQRTWKKFTELRA